MNILNIFISILLLLTGFCTNEAAKRDPVNYFLHKSGIRKTPFQFSQARNGKLLVTNLDNVRNFFVLFRQLLLQEGDNHRQYLNDYNWELGKIQRPRTWDEFPCPLNGTKSSIPPETVDELRPGDIDVVAAIGDSLSAGNGIISKTIIDIAKEFRGLSFSGGGEADWRTALTLPNILKVFNPNLYGFATADVLTVDRNSHLNIAEPMIMSRDLVYQAEILIQRMKKDPRIDMQHHWKLLTIFVGNNDICSDICHYDNLWYFLKKHEEDLRRTFTILRDNVPRLVVNLVPVPNLVTSLGQMRNIPFLCDAVHRVGCHCVFSHLYSAKYMRTISEFITRWQHVDEFVASLPEFQTSDFAVIFQSFTANITIPTLPNGDTDLRFFSSDCFHFSQLGHASAANNLWNNMMQPPGMKVSEFTEPFLDFQCPTKERPFIATLRNSNKHF